MATIENNVKPAASAKPGDRFYLNVAPSLNDEESFRWVYVDDVSHFPHDNLVILRGFMIGSPLEKFEYRFSYTTPLITTGKNGR